MLKNRVIWVLTSDKRQIRRSRLSSAQRQRRRRRRRWAGSYETCKVRAVQRMIRPKL